MIVQPGSFPWLVAHDIRLNWRGLTGLFKSDGTRKAVGVLLAGAVVLHLLAWPLVRWLGHYVHPAGGDTALPLAALIGAIFSWMLAQSLFASMRALYDRADLDLLLGSPLPAARIVAAKASAIMVGTLGTLVLLAAPLANMGALTDSPAWLAMYPALTGLALIATSLGLAIAMALFVLVGPQRARAYGHMTGAALGGSFVLGAQVVVALPASMRSALAQGFGAAGHDRHAAWMAVLSLPADAVRGDIAAMAWLMGIGILMFAAAVLLLGDRFASAAMSAAGAPVPAGVARGASAGAKFRSGIGASLRCKEWRLLMRDHSIFAQLSLQIIYTIPIAVILLRSETVPAAFALVPTLVVIAAQVAGSISWITVSGEDAPELIATAPVSPAAVDRAKLSAVALPVTAILALPLAGLALVSGPLALVAVVFAAGAGTSTALLNFWHPMPGNRRGMLRRHSQSKLIGLVEHGLAMLWALAVVFALAGSSIVVVPLGIVCGILATAARRHRARRPVTPASRFALSALGTS